MSILSAYRLYDPSSPDARLLTETDSSQSLVAVHGGPPNPGDLFKYQDKYIASLDPSNSYEEEWLNAVCGVAKTQLDRLLDRWTRLPQFEEDLRDAERKAETKRRETLQPSVESDNEDEVHSLPRFAGSGVRLSTPTPRRPDSVQPLFTETGTLPIPVPESKTFGPHPPLSPASSYGVSPRSSGSNLPIPMQPGSTNASPRSSITTLPVEAAAAVEAKDKDDDVDLEIPWTLCTRRHYWKYIDGKVADSNTDAPSSTAFSDRHSWTEILASWVCKEAIQEAGYQFTQVQKERRDGRRTKFETCFCIQLPLTFDQVHRLVERTVELYRKTQPRSPPPQVDHRRASFERRSSANAPIPSSHDRDRTPLAKKPQHPPLERAITSIPPPSHPPLDRSNSMPGQVPTYPPNPRSTSLHLPISPISSSQTTAYPPQPPHYSPQPPPYSPGVPPYSPQAVGPPFLPQNPLFASPQTLYPPNPALFSTSFTNYQPPLDTRHLQQGAYPQSPLRHSQSHSRQGSGSHHDYYSSSSLTSDSDSAARERKRRSSSRRRSDRGDGHKKKGHEHSGATKALMGVAGLTALLDGLVGV